MWEVVSDTQVGVCYFQTWWSSLVPWIEWSTKAKLKKVCVCVCVCVCSNTYGNLCLFVYSY